MQRIPTPSSAEQPQNSSTPPGVFVLSIVAGIILIVLGGKSFNYDYLILHKLTHLNEEYQATPAKMLQVKVRRDTAESGDKTYPDVLFEYFVAGKSVWGWRFSFEEEPRHQAYWEKRLQGYHVGDSVTAYVNPLDAKDSFIEKKSDSLLRPGLKALLAAVFILFGAMLFIIPIVTLMGNLGKDEKKKEQ